MKSEHEEIKLKKVESENDVDSWTKVACAAEKARVAMVAMVAKEVVAIAGREMTMSVVF